MLELSKAEHQSLVLMLGSRKEWATFLNLTEKEARSTWTELGLEAPTEYVRGMTDQALHAEIAKRGGYRKAADHLGVSGAFLLSHMRERLAVETRGVVLTKEDLEAQLTKYRSVRLAARVLDITEGKLRKAATELGVELAAFLDYSHGAHSNAKGRRAELDYASMRGAAIVADRNVLDGPQAEYDFDDSEFGRVNVKSACRQKYKARTRKDSPYFWKFSARGREKCDYIVAMFYDDKMQRLLGWSIIDVKALPDTNSFVLLSEEIQNPWPTS